MILRALWLLLMLALNARADSPLILVSLDGFRWDYPDRYAAETPTLRALQREGVTARGLIPVFPSNTFPNHYSIVTGLRPANHGIINNDFFDAAGGTYFHYNQPTIALDPKWWGGEPIWVTAVKQGRKAATAFWVGSEVEINGARPTYWQKFDYRVPFEQRLNELVRWLTLPPAERPAIVAFYLEETNAAGHTFGPDSDEVRKAVQLLDTRLAAVRSRLQAAGIEPNLLIVSDHGMTATQLERVVILDDHIDRASVQIDSDGSVLTLRPLQGDAAGLVRRLAALPHAKAYLAEDLPAHLHLRGGSGRVAPVWVLPDEGWHVVPRSTYERYRVRYAAKGYLQGDHGYDPTLASMHGIFIAQGPAFRRGVAIPAVENIHLYALMCAVLKLTPAPNDGDDRLVRDLLRP